MKNIFKIVFVTVLIISILTPFTLSTADAASKTFTAYVNDKAGVNVRAKATTNSKKNGALKYGTKVTVYTKGENGWSEIRYKKKKAYIKSEFLLFSSVFWNGNYGYKEGSEKNRNLIEQSLKITNQTSSKFNIVIEGGVMSSGGTFFNGYVKAKATYKGNAAKISQGENGDACKLTLTRTKSGVNVTEELGQCDTFHGAMYGFDGTYPLKK